MKTPITRQRDSSSSNFQHQSCYFLSVHVTGRGHPLMVMPKEELLQDDYFAPEVKGDKKQ